MGSNGNLGAVYAGRFIAGLGVGQTPVVGPVYIAEIAPASIRGLCTCIFTGFVYLGIVLAYFTNYGCQINLGDTTPARWEVPTSLHVMFATVIFILSFFQYESPRYLIKQGRNAQALQVMSRLRKLPSDHQYVQHEINAITVSHHEELEATQGTGWLGVLREAFTVPSNLYRVGITIGAQIMSQWSGAGSITLYAPDLFSLLGITGTNESLLVTAVFGIVKLVAAEIGVAIVPRWTQRMAARGVRYVPLKVSEMNRLPLAAAWIRGTRDLMRDNVLKMLQSNLERYKQEA